MVCTFSFPSGAKKNSHALHLRTAKRVTNGPFLSCRKPLFQSEAKYEAIHRIHKWRTRGKKLVPSHESEALEDKQKLQMKTFRELAECLARISPKITLYGLLF